MTNNIVYDTLTGLLEQNIDHFSQNRHHSTSESLLQNFIKIKENLKHVEAVAKSIGEQVHRYDVVPGLQANGYRSLLTIVESLIFNIINELRKVTANCNDTFFRGNQYSEKLRLCSDILHQLRGLLYYAQILMELTPNGDLFVNESDSEPLMHDCEVLAKACFYDSMHGFQYSEGVLPVVNGLSLFVAQYNDIHQPTGAWKTIKSAVISGRYMVASDLRGEKLEEVYNGGDVQFFKKFWSINELGIVQAVPNLMAASVALNKSIQISTEPFHLDSNVSPGVEIRIAFTSSLGNQKKTIQAKLISAHLHEGQMENNGDKTNSRSNSTKKSLPKSKNLVFFCHGGGFVALTSKSYEIILRQWSKQLGCPVLSIDYSLAPEAPFPEGFEECFFAYAWALKHADELGTTAENVVFAGDSAGGNLVLSVALRAGMYGIKMPNSIVSMYPACVVRYSASPARLMSVMDPLLPLGILSGCLGAYSGVKTEKVKREPPYPGLGNDSKPTIPSKQPVRLRYLSNLVRDVSEGFSRMRGSYSAPDVKVPSAPEEDFTHLSTDGNGLMRKSESAYYPSSNSATPSSNSATPSSNSATPSSILSTGFKVNLPHNFQPLKSKFYGDNFKMRHSSVVTNAFISPALANDEMLKRLPHVDIVACEFDPLLDDSVVLAKRLQQLGNSYQFHVVRGLPHGFLNLHIAKEARDASKMCLDLIRKGLNLLKP